MKGKTDVIGINKDRKKGRGLAVAWRPAQAVTQIEGKQNRAKLAAALKH
jgi:hypothetical protein